MNWPATKIPNTYEFGVNDLIFQAKTCSILKPALLNWPGVLKMSREGSPLPSEMKKAVVNLKHYFDRTKHDSKERELTSAERSADALNIGVATVRRIMANDNRDPDSFQKEPFPRGRPKRIICESSQAIVRDYIRHANTEGRHIRLEMLSDYLKETEGGQE